MASSTTTQVQVQTQACPKSIFREVCLCQYCFDHAPSDSWRQALALIRDHGKSYVPGELSSNRCRAVTGSEFSAYMGINMFEKREDAIYKKVFNVRTPDNENMAHGRKYEPIAIAKYEKEHGAQVKYVNFMFHPTYNWIGGTFDGVAFFAATGEAIIIEVKCPKTRSISDKVPDYYMPQVQGYLEISGLNTAHFVQYKPQDFTKVRKILRPEKLIVTEVPKNVGYIERMLPLLWSAWSEIYVKKWAVDSAIDLIAAAWFAHRYYKNTGERKSIKPYIEQFRSTREILGKDLYRRLIKTTGYNLTIFKDLMGIVGDQYVPPPTQAICAAQCCVVTDEDVVPPPSSPKKAKITDYF